MSELFAAVVTLTIVVGACISEKMWLLAAAVSVFVVVRWVEQNRASS